MTRVEEYNSICWHIKTRNDAKICVYALIYSIWNADTQHKKGWKKVLECLNENKRTCRY